MFDRASIRVKVHHVVSGAADAWRSMEAWRCGRTWRGMLSENYVQWSSAKAWRYGDTWGGQSPSFVSGNLQTFIRVKR